MDLDALPYVPARNYTPGRRAPVTLIVIHDMEAGESATTAENCASYFHTTDVRASAHYCCDSNSTVCSVRPDDEAWHTGHGATNRCSIGIEQAGYASQSKADWLDDYSRSMIFGQVAPLVRALADRYGIPLRVLDAGDLRAGNFAGVTTHAAISEAFVPGGHTDPGPNYPLHEMVAAAAGTGDTDMPLTPADADLVAARVRDFLVNPQTAGSGVVVDQGVRSAVAAIQTGLLDPTSGLKAMVAKLSPAQVAAAIPADIAKAVADELNKRLAA